jgi:hypothetical protein
MDELCNKILALIEEAFDESVKEAARAEWPNVSGKATTIDQAESGFLVAIKELIEIRNRQIADIKDLFKGQGN